MLHRKECTVRDGPLHPGYCRYCSAADSRLDHPSHGNSYALSAPSCPCDDSVDSPITRSATPRAAREDSGTYTSPLVETVPSSGQGNEQWGAALSGGRPSLFQVLSIAVMGTVSLHSLSSGSSTPDYCTVSDSCVHIPVSSHSESGCHLRAKVRGHQLPGSIREHSICRLALFGAFGSVLTAVRKEER